MAFKKIIVMDYKTLVNNYDFEGMDQIYEKLIETGSVEDKKELAELGYLHLFSCMDFDFSCGKLTDFGIDLLLPVLEKSEKLLNQQLWYERGRAFSNLMETHMDKNWELAREYGNSAICSYTKNIEQNAESLFNSWIHLAEIYDWFSKKCIDDRLVYWKQAIQCIEETIKLKPVSAPWLHYLKLLYLPLDSENRSFFDFRTTEQERFRGITRNLGDSNLEIAFTLASEYKRYYEYIAWYKLNFEIFPETDYLYWLEKAKDWYGNEGFLSTNEVGHLYHNEGIRLSRKDLLLVAIDRFTQLIKTDDSAFPILYAANSMEDLARLLKSEGMDGEATHYLNRALLLYEENLEMIKSNFSTLLNYGEFMERCAYEYIGNHKKPSPNQILLIALMAETEGEGFYSRPYSLMVKLALHMGDIDKAIFHYTQMLLLHELCLEEDVKKDLENPLFYEQPKMKEFLIKTIHFMESVREGYYLYQTCPWEKVRLLTPYEGSKIWENRCIELRQRPQLEQENKN